MQTILPAAAPASPDCPEPLGIPAQCTGLYADLPQDVVTSGCTGGPILGNGEIGATLGGTPDCQTFHLNRLDNWGRALGGLSITSDKGGDAPSYRYEQDIEKAEVRAKVLPHVADGQDARFRHLRAKGAFLVSADLKGGQVGGIRILSGKGGDLVVQNPWPGKSVRVLRKGAAAETVSGDRFTLKTAPGETLEFQVQ